MRVTTRKRGTEPEAQAPPGRRGSGFTLVETLVAMAIVAVLAGIVWTLMAPARERARQTVCIGNLHRIGVALMQYRADYGGQQARVGVPMHPSRLGLPPDDPVGVQAVLAEYLDYPVPYPAVPAVWRCPDDPDPNRFSYGYGGSGPVQPSPYLIKGVAARGEELPIFTDTNHWKPGGHPDTVILLRLNGKVERKQVAHLPGSDVW